MSWSVPRMWDGKTVAILASGPSMRLELAQCVAFMGLPTIVINTTFLLAPWASMLYAADAVWWDHNRDAARFRGLRVTVMPESTPPDAKLPDCLRGAYWLRNTGTDGFDERPDCVRTGSNSGYQALHVAVHAGAARVLLLGFDMHGGHWHGEHPDGLANTTPETYVAKYIPKFATMRPALRERHVEVINCTPGSALECFPIMDLESALAERAVVAA